METLPSVSMVTFSHNSSSGKASGASIAKQYIQKHCRRGNAITVSLAVTSADWHSAPAFPVL